MAKRIALVHDYIKEYGGAERVLETLHEMYPDAPVFTLVYAPQFLGPHKERFASWDIRPSFLQYIPFSYKFISIYRLVAPFVFKTFNFLKYDVVIVSATGAYSPNSISVKRKALSGKNKEKNFPLHVCYCHTPPRYLYGYATARQQSSNKVLRMLTALMVHVLRIVDYYSSKNVDVFIANSENVKKRIEKFYRRDAVVVYPPVDIPLSFPRRRESIQIRNGSPIGVGDDNSYYLAGGRLARPKHIDLIVKACAELGVPLKVFGRGFAGYEENLKSQISNLKSKEYIEMLGEVSDAERSELMKGARAFIFAAEDEDFGIIPVEAMGQGTPVIAYKSGGVLETIVDSSAGSGQVPTGVFFDKLTVESLKKAIKKSEASKIDPKACYNQAKKFGKEEFIKHIKEIIEK